MTDELKNKKEKLVPISEAAEVLGVSIDTVRRWDKQGILHSSRPNGKNRYFSLDDLEKVKFSRPLTISQAASHLGISAATLRRLEEKGIITSDRPKDGKRLYSRESIEKFLNSEYFLRQKEVQEKVLEPFKEPEKEAHPVTAKTEAAQIDTEHKVLGSVVTQQDTHIRRLVNFRKVLTQSGLFLVTLSILTISILTLFFLIYPEATGTFFRYRLTGFPEQNGLSGLYQVWPKVLGATSSVDQGDIKGQFIKRILQPFGQLSLGIAKQINEDAYLRAVSPPTIENINDVFVLDIEGNIRPYQPIRLPESTYLRVPDAGLITNLNADYIRGKVPGDGPGDLVTLNNNGDLDLLGRIISPSITEQAIVDKSITGDKIADGAINSLNLGQDSVLTSHIKDGEVHEQDIADGAVTLQKLADNIITSSEIINNTITNLDLSADSVTSAIIKDGEVKTADIATGAVTTEKLGSLSVSTVKIQNGAVTEQKIADGSVTTDKLADDSVTTSKISDGEVNTADIADASITSSKINDNTITTSDLSSALTFIDGDFLDLAAIIHDDSALQGLRLPNVSSATPTNLVSGEGFIAWDTSGNQVIVYDGTSWGALSGGGGSGDITAVGNCATGACFTGTSGSILTFSNGELITNAVDGTISFTDGTNTLLSIVDQGTTGNVTASGDLTISGDDLFMATNTSGFILVADGTNFNPVDASGDVDISSAGVMTIQSNSVALGTDTTNNYVATIADAGNSTITVSGSGTETAAVTLDVVDVNCTDCLNATEIADIYLFNSGDTSTGTLTFSGVATDIEAVSGEALTLNSTSANIALQTTTSGNITATTAAGTGLVNILTGNLKVGNGTPGNTQDGEDAYIEGFLEVDGVLFADGGIQGNLSCTDCLDFDEFEDTLDLDTALILNQTTNTWTQTYTGTSAAGLTYTASGAVTSGDAAALDINVTNSSTTVPAVTVINAGTGSGIFIDQDGNATSLNIDSEATSADLVNLDGSVLTTGNLIQGVVTDTLNTNTALVNVTGTALNTATLIKFLEISTTAANDVDIAAIHIERGTDDARIVYDEGTDTWMLDQGTGAGLLAISTGAGGSTTLQGAYDNDVDGSNANITLSTADDSIVINNPSSSGTDAAFALQIDQNAGGVISLDIDSEATTADLVNLDGSVLTTGNLIQGVVTDTLNTDVALINVTGTALNTATLVKLIELSTTPANDVDVAAIHLERGANDARIVYDEGTDTWMLDQGTGAGLLAISTGAGGSTTLQGAYDNDVDGSDAVIALSTADDSIEIDNPAASGTDSAFAFFIDQNDTSGVDAFLIDSESTDSNAILITHAGDGTDNAAAAAISITAESGAGGLFVTRNLGAGDDDPLVEILSDHASGDQPALFIDNDAIAGIALDIDAENTTADIINISAAPLTTGIAIDIPDLDALTSGNALNIVSNSSSTTPRTLVQITNDNASAEDAIVLALQQDADDVALSIGANSAGSVGINLFANALTSGTGQSISSSSSALTSGELLDIDLNASSATLANKTGNLSSVAASRTSTRTTGTTADDYDLLNLSRTSVQNGVGGTTTAAGSVLRIENVATQTAGTLTDTVKGIELVMDADGSGDAIFIDSNSATGISLNIDSEATSADLINLDGSVLTTGNLIQGVVTDTLNTDVALINVTGTALNAATLVKFLQLSTTPANDVDVAAIHIERGTDDARIVYDEGTDTWMLDQGAGAGLVTIATGTGGSATLQTAYNNDADGSNATVALTTADDSIVINNPSSSGTDSAFALQIDQDAAAVIALDIDAENTTADIINISAAPLTTGTAIDIPDLDALTTGRALNIVSNSSNTSNRTLAQITNDNTSADGTNVLGLQQDADGNALDIVMGSSSFGIGVNVTSSGVDGTGVRVIGNSMTSGSGIGVTQNALVDGAGIFINSGSEAITTGQLFDAALTSSGTANANKTGSLAEITSSRTDTRTTGTTADDYDLLNLSRTSVQNGAGGTTTAAGSVLRIENVATQTAGTLTDTVKGIELVMDADGSGDAIFIDSNGTATTSQIALNIDSESTTADAIALDGTLLTTGDGLQITVDNSMTTGKAIRVLGGASGTTEVFNVDDDGATVIAGDITWTAATPSIILNAAETLTIGPSGGDSFVINASGSLFSFSDGTNSFSFDVDSGPVYAGTARPTRKVTLSPEFPGATLTGDGSSNTGTMTSDFCEQGASTDIPDTNTSICNTAGDIHTYYNWTTTSGTAQDYDVWIRWRVPDNFAAWAASNPVNVYGKRTDTTNNAVTVFVYDTAGTLENASGTQVAGTAWTQTSVEASFGGTYTAGSYMTIRIVMNADTNDTVNVGEISLDYLTNN